MLARMLTHRLITTLRRSALFTAALMTRFPPSQITDCAGRGSNTNYPDIRIVIYIRLIYRPGHHYYGRHRIRAEQNDYRL